MNEGMPTRLIVSFGPEIHVGGAIWRQATQEEMLILWQLGVRIACQAVAAADIGTPRTPRRFRVNGIAGRIEQLRTGLGVYFIAANESDIATARSILAGTLVLDSW